MRARQAIRNGSLALLLVLTPACQRDRPVDPEGGAAPEMDDAIFVDVAAETGLDFVHYNGMSDQLYLCEMMGPGAALLDFDDDGDLDLFIVQGEPLDSTPAAPQPDPPGDRLYRNDLVVDEDGARTLRFTDVTEGSGLGSGYGMGVAAGDFDNDGRVDLYVTRFGANQLLRNEGGGRFRDVTAASGTAEERWSVSASFVDYDRDGWLDLYVGNYLDFHQGNHKKCFNLRDDYCSPARYNPVPDRLFRNRGDGSFEDRSTESRIVGEFGGALGVVATDLDGDRWPDIYVANDGLPNQCWINRGDGTFENTALLGGSALNEMGEAEAGMGVDVGDFDNDGDEDLIVAHLATETNTLYVNDGSGLFVDQTVTSNLAASSLALTGFGAGWLDFDNDGWLDMFVANGAVTLIEELALSGDPFPLHQPNLLLRNSGEGRFENWTARGGAALELSEVSRGATFGDVDNDGDTDVLVLNNNGPARLLLNRRGQRHGWIGLRMIGGNGGRDMLGTRVAVELTSGGTLWRRVGSDGSYASSGDPRVLFGFGPAHRAVSVRAVWPDGRTERWDAPPHARWSTLLAGSGQTVE